MARPQAVRHARPLSSRTRSRQGPPQVFICYREEDTRWPAGRLHDSLETRFGEKSVFRDKEDITPGEDFLSEIRNAIQAADVVLVVIGPRWLEKPASRDRPRLFEPEDYVRQEIEIASAAGRRVLPVLVERARMPSEAELPDSLRWLSFRHAARVEDATWTTDVEELIQRLVLPPPLVRDRFMGIRELQSLAPGGRLRPFILHALSRPLNFGAGVPPVLIGSWREPWLIAAGIGIYLLLSFVTFFDAHAADGVRARLLAAHPEGSEPRESR
jgi:hypothetical protein